MVRALPEPAGIVGHDREPVARIGRARRGDHSGNHSVGNRGIGAVQPDGCWSVAIETLEEGRRVGAAGQPFDGDREPAASCAFHGEDGLALRQVAQRTPDLLRGILALVSEHPHVRMLGWVVFLQPR